MKKYVVLVVCLYCFSAKAEVTNIEAKGNLAPANPIRCVDITGLNDQNTPADIFVGINDCIEKDNYHYATRLYMAALALGHYDTKRVVDKSAYQAITVLRMNQFGGLKKDKVNKLQAALKETTSNMESICKALRQVGRPEYYPAYMVRHGMGDFVGDNSKTGLVKNFDPEVAWRDTLKDYLKCKSV